MAQVFIAETTGYTKFGITAEDFRDHFDKIEDQAEFIVPDGPDDFHARMFESIVKAGAEPLETGSAASKIAIIRQDNSEAS